MIDNLRTQRYPSLFNLPVGNNYHFIEEDICTANLKEYFKNIDIVIHLAAITDAASSVKNKEDVFQVNLVGTEKVADACILNNCKLFFPSTTSVYGTQNEVVDENCSKDELKPQSPYAQSKFEAEMLLQDLGKYKGLKFIICRFGTIYGTSIGIRFHTAVNKFCWQAVLKQPITVWKTALDQKRPYLSLNDAIQSIKFISNKDLFNNSIYNVVTENVTVNDIISIIKKYIPDLSIEFVNTSIMNQLSYEVSNKKFLNEGFVSEGNINSGIFDIINLLKDCFYRIPS
jgi:nucleoside-diphosphate-sugar epimerase